MQKVCDLPSGGVGGTWNAAGDILIGSSAGPLRRVSALGGTPVTEGALDTTRGETSQRFPLFLPDGGRYVYLSRMRPESFIAIGRLGSTGTTTLFPGDSQVFYTDPGYLVFSRRGVLVAQRFDPTTGRGADAPISLADDVGTSTGGGAALAASPSGVVSFRSYDIDPMRLVRVDRTGRRLGEIGPPGPYFQFSLSGDGRHIGIQRNQGLKAEIWIVDVDRGTAAKATESSAASSPVWSPAGSDLAFVAERGTRTVFRLSVSDGKVATVADDLGSPIIEDWSRDGRYLAYMESSAVWALPLLGDRKPFEVVRRRTSLDEPQFSPDGRSIAYNAADTGRSEVYVQPFPGPGGSIAVSTSGGAQPMWRADGKELFYLAPDGTLMAAEMRDGRPAPAPPAALFKTGLAIETIRTLYAPLPGGQQFIVLMPDREAAIRPIQVVINWPATIGR